MMTSKMSPRATKIMESKRNQEILRRVLKKVIRDAKAHCKEAKRKTVTVEDVVYALKRLQGCTF